MTGIVRALRAVARHMEDRALGIASAFATSVVDPVFARKEAKLWADLAAECEQLIAERTPVEQGGAK
jgi:hypothetical protein